MTETDLDEEVQESYSRGYADALNDHDENGGCDQC